MICNHDPAQCHLPHQCSFRFPPPGIHHSLRDSNAHHIAASIYTGLRSFPSIPRSSRCLLLYSLLFRASFRSSNVQSRYGHLKHPTVFSISHKIIFILPLQSPFPAAFLFLPAVKSQYLGDRCDAVRLHATIAVPINFAPENFLTHLNGRNSSANPFASEGVWKAPEAPVEGSVVKVSTDPC